MTAAVPGSQPLLVRAQRALTAAAYCSLAIAFLAFTLWSSNAFDAFSWDARTRAIDWASVAIGWAPGGGGLLAIVALIIAFRTRVGYVAAIVPVLVATLYYIAIYSVFAHLPAH